jgi:endonuclease YncB( thermonuclease family)
VAIVGGEMLKIRDDTQGQHMVRSAGVDAPEKFQAFGQRSQDPSREQSLPQADRESCAAIQEDARQRRTGIWRDRQAIPPWKYRAGRRM